MLRFIRPLLGQFFVLVFVGADSSLSPFVASDASLPPHDACWWEATGALFVKLCDVLLIDSSKTPYFLELYNGHRSRFTVKHFDLTQSKHAHDARFRLSYCEYIALFQTNIRSLRDDLLSSHDLVIGKHTNVTPLFSHAKYSFVLAQLIYGSCQSYFDNLV